MQSSIKSTSKRSTLVRCIKNQTARLASKKLAVQTDLFAPLPDLNGAVPAVTAPTVPVPVVGLLTCLHPQPKFVPPSSYMWTGCDQFGNEVRDEFVSATACHGAIDAPLYVPTGGLSTTVFGNRCAAFGAVHRG